MHQVFIEGGLIRKLWSVEMDAYRDHLLRLDAESRRSRFSGTIADDIVRTYAATVRGSDVIVHGFFVDGVLRGAADLRILGPLYRREAEAAFSIEKPWQSHGVGSALLERSLLAARNRGIQLLHVYCLAENHRMQQLARKFDAELTFDFGTVTGKMENPHPTPLSVMRELAVDGHSFAAAYVDFQSRLLRPMGALVRLPQPCPPQVHSLQILSKHGDFNEKHRPETVDLGLCTV
jgi:GNAT superfamily N-acetyltransferase